jgi:hypothetical protein
MVMTYAIPRYTGSIGGFVMEIEVARKGEHVTLTCPYYPDLIPRAHELGGNYLREIEAWVFDANDEDRVRLLAYDIFGTDGSCPVETVNVRVDLNVYARRPGDTIWGFGRRIAYRRERDWSVLLGEDIVVVNGGFNATGGSKAKPAATYEPGTVLELRHVPASIVRTQAGVSVVESSIDVPALQRERLSLMDRLRTIEDILAGHGG